jgi:hypothetical protein
MILDAITTGYAIPHTDFDAVVHSVFHSALNLRPSDGNELLTLVVSSEADLPQGMRINTPDSFSFENFCTGEQVTFRDDILRLDSLTVDLRGAQPWKCDLPALQADTAKPAVASAWSTVWQALNARQIQAGAEIIAQDLFRTDESVRAGVPRKAGEAMRGLLDATRRCDLTAAISFHTLIGLGSGLTPSGDDLLIGYLTGLWCTVREAEERRQFALNLGKAVIRLSRRTNDISRTYLYHAAHAQVSSRLETLAAAICCGENSERLLATAESAMQVGHTSGADAVTGLLMGLVVWALP